MSRGLERNLGFGSFPAIGCAATTIAVILLVGLGASACVQVDKGYVGVKTTWGRVELDSLKPGLHFVMPIAQQVIHVNL